MFWSSVDLTGNQTRRVGWDAERPFWSSVDLTGNQTGNYLVFGDVVFWSSVDLTGNQTAFAELYLKRSFGAVSI